MKKIFDEFLKNGLSEYDAQYLKTYDFVMLLKIKDNIYPYFANIDYTAFIEYPDELKNYENAAEVLEEEMKLTDADSGIIYENKESEFIEIAYINNQEKNKFYSC